MYTHTKQNIYLYTLMYDRCRLPNENTYIHIYIYIYIHIYIYRVNPDWPLIHLVLPFHRSNRRDHHSSRHTKIVRFYLYYIYTYIYIYIYIYISGSPHDLLFDWHCLDTGGIGVITKPRNKHKTYIYIYIIHTYIHLHVGIHRD